MIFHSYHEQFGFSWIQYTTLRAPAMDAIWWEEQTSSTRFRNVHSCDWMFYLTWVAMTMMRHRKIHNGLMAACYLVPVWVLHSWKIKVRVVLLCSPTIFNRRIAMSKHNSPDDRFPAFWADLHEFQLQSPNQKMNGLYILIFPSPYLAILNHKYCTAVLDCA